MFHVRSLLIIASLALSVLSGCATRYEVTENQVQEAIDQKLPFTESYGDAQVKAVIKLDKLTLRLPEQADKPVQLAGSGTLTTGYGGFSVDQPLFAKVAGRLKYSAPNKQIYLANPQVTALEAPALAQLLAPDVYNTLISEAKTAFVTTLRTQPLYTVTDTTFSERLFREHGSSIETYDRKIIFNLD